MYYILFHSIQSKMQWITRAGRFFTSLKMSVLISNLMNHLKSECIPFSFPLHPLTCQKIGYLFEGFFYNLAFFFVQSHILSFTCHFNQEIYF